MSTVEFNQMLVNNAEFLKPFAITLTRDQEAAKDLFQETLYRALANRDKYNVGTNIKAWLYTIMRNIFINNYRRKVKQNTIFDSTPNDFLINQTQSVVANNAESNLRLKDIQEAIHNLPQIFRNSNPARISHPNITTFYLLPTRYTNKYAKLCSIS